MGLAFFALRLGGANFGRSVLRDTRCFARGGLLEAGFSSGSSTGFSR
jgi:hypothetical protein